MAPAARVSGGGGGAVCGTSFTPESLQGVQFPDNEEVNASLQAFLSVNSKVGQILGGGDQGLLASAHDTLLKGAFPTPIKILAQNVVGQMFMCLPESTLNITNENIDAVIECITDVLMKDAPLTKVVPVIGNLFLSLFYGSNPARIVAAVGHATATGYMAWIGGLNRVASLSIESARMVFLGLMAGWGYIGAPNAPPVFQEPRFQGPLPFNASNAEAYWGKLNLNAADPGGLEIIEEIRVMLRDQITDPANQLLCLAELTRRVFDMCVPVGPGFRPFQRFQNAPLGAQATNFEILVSQIRGGVNTVFNFLGGLCDMVRKLPYQGVGQMGPDERSFRHQLSNQFAILVGGVYRSFHAQGLLRGFSEDQINQIFLRSLLDIMVPPDFRDAAEHGYTISAKVQLGILASKIRSRVVECCAMKGVSEDMLAQICPYFRSGLTESTLAEHVRHDLMEIFDNLAATDQASQLEWGSMDAVAGSDTPPDQRNASVNAELEKLQDLGFAEVVTPGEAASLKSLRDNTGVVGMVCTLPDKCTQAVKGMIVGGAITLGSTTHAQIRSLLEEAARPQLLAMSHKYPPDPLVFLVHISAVLDVCHEAVQKGQTQGQSREAVLAEIQRELPRFGKPAAVEQFVRSIIRMSIVWSLSSNPKLFTLAIKTPINGEPYVVLLVNFDSIQGWDIGKGGHIERKKGVLEVPLEFLGDCTRGIVESLGNRASGVLGWAKSLITGRACAVAGGGVQQMQALQAPPQSSAQSPVMCVPAGAAAGAAAGGEMTKLSPLDATDPKNDENIAERTRLVEDCQEIQVQKGIQVCASKLLGEGVGGLNQYGAIPSADADGGISAIPLPPTFNSFSLPTDLAGTGGGGTAPVVSSPGGAFSLLPVTAPPFLQQSPVLGDLDTAAQHLKDAAAAENDAADRLAASVAAVGAASGLQDVMAEPLPPAIMPPAVVNVPSADDVQANADLAEFETESGRSVKKPKDGGKSRKTTKRTRRNKGRKSSSKTSKKTRQRRDRRSSRHRRSSRKGRK